MEYRNVDSFSSHNIIDHSAITSCTGISTNVVFEYRTIGYLRKVEVGKGKTDGEKGFPVTKKCELLQQVKCYEKYGNLPSTMLCIKMLGKRPHVPALMLASNSNSLSV